MRRAANLIAAMMRSRHIEGNSNRGVANLISCGTIWMRAVADLMRGVVDSKRSAANLYRGAARSIRGAANLIRGSAILSPIIPHG